jgi:formamidopyrimidine-DNA glycosylase
MPELPEVETVTRGIEPILVGHKISALKFYRDNLRDQFPKKELRSILVEQKITSVFRRSKYILVGTKKGFLLIHLGMTGNILSFNTAKPQLPHTHVVLTVKDSAGGESYLHYIDPRRFGRFAFHQGQDWQNHLLLSSLGPEPLELRTLAQHLFQVSRDKKTPIKTFLMDPKNVVGVGNIYACESLFAAGVDPRLSAGSLSLETYRKLSKLIKKILRSAIKQGGTTLKDFKNTEGNKGYFAISLKVYGRASKPCLECENSIQIIKQSGRSTFFCPFCQK